MQVLAQVDEPTVRDAVGPGDKQPDTVAGDAVRLGRFDRIRPGRARELRMRNRPVSRGGPGREEITGAVSAVRRTDVEQP